MRFIIICLISLFSFLFSDIQTVFAKDPFRTDAIVSKILASTHYDPFYTERGFTGMRLYAIKAGSFWDKNGFKNGDILKEINGHVLDSQDSLIKYLTEVVNKEKSAHEFKIERMKISLSLKYKGL